MHLALYGKLYYIRASTLSIQLSHSYETVLVVLSVVFMMGWKCCVPNCKSGYALPGSRSKDSTRVSDTSTGTCDIACMDKISFFSFPTCEKVLSQWMKAIPRENITLTKNTRICSLHFHKEDILTLSQDSNISRKAKRARLDRKNVRLKPSAVPKIFPHCPKYLSKSATVVRSAHTSAESRRQLENDILNTLEKELHKQDSVNSFQEFCDKLQREVIPSGYTIVSNDLCSTFLYISDIGTSGSAPDLRGTVRVTADLHTEVFIKKSRLHHRNYQNLFKKTGILSSVSELTNLLAFVKSLCNNSSDMDSSAFVDIARDFLYQYLEDDDAEHTGFFRFVVEQIDLLKMSAHSRQYSCDTILTAFLWHMIVFYQAGHFMFDFKNFSLCHQSVDFSN